MRGTELVGASHEVGEVGKDAIEGHQLWRMMENIDQKGFNIAIKDELLDIHDWSKLSASRTVDPSIHHLMDWYEFWLYNIMATVALESRRLGKYSSNQMQANEALDVVGLEFHRIE
eukprot:scaffold1244_cov94-Skeletonema_dohrnii-CCMP3373.AAC.1